MSYYEVTCSKCGSLLGRVFAERLWITNSRGNKQMHCFEVKLSSCAVCSDLDKARAIELEVTGRLLDVLRKCRIETGNHGEAFVLFEKYLKDVLREEGDYTHHDYSFNKKVKQLIESKK